MEINKNLKEKIFAASAAIVILSTGLSILYKDRQHISNIHKMVNGASAVAATISEKNRTANHFYMGETKHDPKIREPYLNDAFLDYIVENTPNLPKNEYGNVAWGKLQIGQRLCIPDLNLDRIATGKYPE